MTEQPDINKQFIAGARCPQCNQQDVLVFYRQQETPVRECVECDFKEVLVEQDNENKKEQPNAALEIKILEL